MDFKESINKFKSKLKSKDFKIGASVVLLASASAFAIFKTPSNLITNPHQVIKSSKSSSLKGALYASADNNGKTNNPTTLSDTELSKPSSYPYWLQYWGPWATEFGGKGTGGDNWKPPGGNGGCVATALAIQMARGGVKKAADNSDFNPKSNQDSNHAAQQTGCAYAGLNSYKTGDKGTITRDPKVGSTNGSYGGDPTEISPQDALDKCKKIADAGNYPLIRCNHNGHTVAYWKPSQDGKKPLWYDPARGANYSAVQNLTYVGQMDKGQMSKFQIGSPGPVGGPDGTNGNASSQSGDSSEASTDNSEQAQTGGADIKPIWNPFYTPMLHQVPADQVNQDPDNPTRAQLLQLADGIGPEVLSWIRAIMVVLIYFYSAIVIFGSLVKIVDTGFGSYGEDYLNSHMNDGFAKSFLMPNGSFLGIEGFTVKEIFMSAVKRFLPIAIVLLLIASGTVSRLISLGLDIFMKLFPHVASFIHVI